MLKHALSGRSLRNALIASGLSIAAIALSACSEEPKPVEAEVRPVKIMKVEPHQTVATLVYSGSVKARTEMNLGFRLNGKIVERRVDVGDRVRKGDVLMRLDPTDVALAVDRARASLDSSRQQFTTAEAAYKRADQLFRQKTVPMAVLEQRKLAYDQALAQRTAAEAQLDEATNQLSYTDLKADRDGVVTAVQADAGQVVGAGNVAVVLADDREKEAVIAVPEMDISAFSIGQPVRAGFWADPSLTLRGKVREIAASADPLSRTFAVRVALEDNPKVLLGMTATVTAERTTAASTVDVPLAALSTQQGQPVVWVVDAATSSVEARPVKTGPFTADGVRIENGLSRGDLVVAAGTQFMTDKLKVRLPEGFKEAVAGTPSLRPAS